MRRTLSLVSLLAVAACAAQPVSTDPNAVPAVELLGMIKGHSVRIGPGTATYSEYGRYSYNGNIGSYTVTDGTICVLFDRGERRCDQVLRAGKGFVFVTGSGDRVPFRILPS